MSDDPLMAMYEAQAIEKQQEIDRLKREKEELLENLNRNEDKLEKKFSKLCKYFGIPLILGCLIICAVVFLIPWTAIDNTTKRKYTSETILIMGGGKNNTAHAGMAVLSQDRTKWIEIERELPYRAFGSGAIYLNGEIYLFGGYFNLKALYKLDKNLNWIRLADMNVGRWDIENSCLEWNGNIWVFGGADENIKPLKSVERYDPKENKWTLMADMKHVRPSAAATLWNNKIIICGGSIGELTITNSAECYNPEDNSWIEFPSLPEPLGGGHSLVTYENKFILFGGSDGKEATNAVWELDPQESNRTWKPLEPMEYRSYHFAGKIVDQEIYAIGGRQIGYLSRVEIFDGERWRDGAALSYTWARMSSVIIPQTLADRLCRYKKE